MLFTFPALLTLGSLVKSTVTLPERSVSETERVVVVVVVAMVEVAAHQKGIQVPTWTQEIAPLPQPYFGSSFKNLQLYLLAHSPVPFRRRNIFIDATIGERI